MSTSNRRSRLCPGIWPVVPTPFLDGSVDEAALTRIVQRLVSAGVHGLWVLGLGSEQAFLDDAEQETVLRTVLSAAPETPRTAGVTASTIELAIQRTERWERHGCGSVFALQPGAADNTPAHVVRFYRELAAIGLETVAYVDTGVWEVAGVPGGAIVSGLDPLWESPIVGVKLACRDFRLWIELAARALAQDLLVYTASGRLALSALCLGAHGLVADDATVAPERYVALFDACGARDHALARERQRQLVGIGRAISEAGIGGTIFALSRQGLCALETRRAALPDAAAREAIELGLRGLETGREREG